MKKILVIEDNHDIRENICELLELTGYETCQAPNGLKGVESAQKNSPDLIICDIMMPEMDGYETISAIRKNQKYKNLPIFAVTAKAMIGDRDKCIKVGASDYISKPVDTDQLLSLLRVWLYKG